jgi:dihydrofolate reductase
VPAQGEAARPQLVLVAAVARNGAIGRDNALLWTEPADQRHFRQLTVGAPVVMGRRTWQSLPDRFRPLPGRRNLVVSRDAAFDAPGAELVPSLDAALARVAGAPRVCVIGGAQLYALALPRADVLELTEVDADLDGDTFFPPWDHAAFVEHSRAPQVGADGTRFDFVRYVRRTGG